jgi:hypothetical protein
MSVRLLLLLACLAALASATPLTLTIVGIGDGSLNGVSFVDQSFEFIFTTDTTDLVTPSSEPTDESTPSGTPATFTVDGVTATLDGIQAIFEHPGSEMRLGIWQENSQDWLTITDAAFENYNLQSNLTVNAPSSEVTALSVSGSDPMPTDKGDLYISSIESGSTTTFTATLSPTSSASTAPEPSTFAFLCVGAGGMLIGLRRRRSS